MEQLALFSSSLTHKDAAANEMSDMQMQIMRSSQSSGIEFYLLFDVKVRLIHFSSTNNCLLLICHLK